MLSEVTKEWQSDTAPLLKFYRIARNIGGN